MGNDEIISLIKSKYSGQNTEVLVENLEKMSPVIKKALETFLQTGNHKQINLFGYSIQNLTSEHKMTEIAAYLTLDWIVREPDRALESLTKGHDVVKPQSPAQ